MKTKERGILIAALLIVSSAIILVSAAAPAAATTVVISDASASASDTTTTTVTAYDVENLGNFGITLTFDPTVVNVTDIIGGPGVGTFSWGRTADDQVQLYTLNLGLTEPIPSLSGDVLLATVTLLAIGEPAETSPLDITIGALYKSDGTKIDAVDVDGTFSIALHPPVPEVSIMTDKNTYQPGDNMQVSTHIKNPMQETLTFEWYAGVPQFSLWMPIHSMPIPPGYDDTLDIEITIGSWGSSPFAALWYVHLLDQNGEVLDQDCACWAYSPGIGKGKAMPADIADEIGRIKTNISCLGK